MKIVRKILYITQVFEVYNDTGSDRDFHYCRYATQNGFEVEVITCDVDYKNAAKRSHLNDGESCKVIEGVKIHYVYSYKNFRGSFYRRLIYYFSYILPTIYKATKIKSVDCIYAVSTPLVVGLIAYAISKLKRVPFIFEITDVWPDAAVECGVVKNKLLIKIAQCVEMFCYRHAEHIVVLADHAKENLIGKGVSPEKISVITNGADLMLFESNTHDYDNQIIPNDLNDKFIAMYLGAHGAYNSLFTIIEAAELLSRISDIHFVLVGDGDVKPDLVSYVESRKLKNITFLAPIERSKTPNLLHQANVFLLPNLKGSFFEGNLPNKLFDYLASARPVVAAANGEIRKLVIDASCGRVVQPGNSKSFANEILNLYNMTADERILIGQSGKEHIEKYYSRDALSSKIHNIVKKTLRS